MFNGSSLREYGLLGSFDTVANMLGERIAIVTGFSKEKGNYESEMEQEELDENEEELEEQEDELITEGIMYAELQQNSMSLCTQLSYRFGVRKEDKVVIACEGNTGAEVVAMLASIRLGAIFVPIETKHIRTHRDDSVFSTGDYYVAKQKVASIIDRIKPSAVVIVGKDDNDEIVHFFNSLSLYRCALLDPKGNLVEEDATVTSGLVGTVPDNSAELQDTLYILHTSGSTGESKGVMGSYRGLINRIAWQYESFRYEFGEMILRRTPLTFVDSMAEIFCPLLAGVPIVSQYYHEINVNGLMSIMEEINEIGITRITLIPSQLNSLLKIFDQTASSYESFWSSLTCIIISGEECPMNLITTFKENLSSCSLLNIYGSTEVSGDITCAILHQAIRENEDEDEDEEEKNNDNQEETEKKEESLEDQGLVDGNKVSIGQVLPGNAVFVVNYSPADSKIEIVTDENEIGELLVIGSHVANGYFQHENSEKDLNEHRFIQNPFLDEEFSTKYQTYLAESKYNNDADNTFLFEEQFGFLTGDLVTRRKIFNSSTSSMENIFFYHGRKDRSMKIRGNKIDLEEIEREIRNLFHLSDGIVVFYLHANELPEMNDHQVSSLILVIDETILSTINNIIFETVMETNTLDSSILRKYLQQHLSSLHLPGVIFLMNLQDFRTTSFKIHRQKLFQEIKKKMIQSITTTTQKDKEINQNKQESLLSTLDLLNCSKEEISSCLLKLILESLHLPFGDSSSKNEKFNSVTYFDLGGNSISSIEMVWQLKKSFKIQFLTSFHLSLPLPELSDFIFNQIHHYNNLTSEKEDEEFISPPTKKFKSSSSHHQSFSSKVFYQRFHSYDGGDILSSINRSNKMTGNRNLTYSDPNKSTWSELKLSWRYPLSKCIDAAPVIGVAQSSASDVVVIGSHGGDIVCLNANSGDCYWQTVIFEHIEAAVVLSTQQQHAYVTSFLGNDIDGFQTHQSSSTEPIPLGKIRCLSISTGEVLWTFATEGEVKQSITLDEENHRLFCGCYNSIVYQVDMLTGQLIHSLPLAGGAIYSSFLPTKDFQKMYAFTTRGSMYLIDIDSTQNEMNCLWEWNYYEMPIFSTPFLYETPSIEHDFLEHRLWISFVNGEMVCLKLTNQSKSLENEVQSAEEAEEPSSPYQFELLWQKELSTGSFFSSISLINNSQPNCHDDLENMIGVIGCHDGILRMILLHSGDLVQELSFGSVLFVSPFYLSAASDVSSDNGDLLSVATAAGDLILMKINQTDRSPQQIIKTNLNGEIFSSPIIYQNRIYIGCRDDHLYCFEF